MTNDGALFQVLDTAAALERAVDKQLGPLGLTITNWRALNAIGRAEAIGISRMQPGVLAALLLQENHSVSGLLNRLEAQALIAREHDTTDRRAVTLALTEKGRELEREARALVEATAADYATMITPKSRIGLDILVDRAFDLSNAIAPFPQGKRARALQIVGGAE